MGRASRFLAFALLALGMVPGAAVGQGSTFSGVSVLQQMHDAYAGRWYSSLTFTQRTTSRGRDGAEQVGTWYESLRYTPPTGTQLRIDTGDPAAGNGALYSGDSTWIMGAGKVVAARLGGNALLPLIEGVYMQPVERTVTELAASSIDLHRSVIAGRWNDRDVWIVGATSRSDTTSPQFWVDQERNIVVRAILAPAPSLPKMDVRLDDVVSLAGGWLATKCTFLVNWVPAQVEEYTGWKANGKLADALFDVASWTTAPHWATAGTPATPGARGGR